MLLLYIYPSTEADSSFAVLRTRSVAFAMGKALLLSLFIAAVILNKTHGQSKFFLGPYILYIVRTSRHTYIHSRAVASLFQPGVGGQSKLEYRYMSGCEAAVITALG